MCDAISWMNCDVLLCVYSGVSLVNVCTTQAHLQRRTTACTVTFATYFRRSITWHAPKLQMKIGNASVGTAASYAAKLVAIIMEKMTSLLKILLMMILLRRFDVKFVIHFEVVYIMIVFDLVWRKRLRLARTTPNTAIRCPSLIATLKVIAKLAARNVKRNSTDTPVCCRTSYLTWKYIIDPIVTLVWRLWVWRQGCVVCGVLARQGLFDDVTSGIHQGEMLWNLCEECKLDWGGVCVQRQSQVLRFALPRILLLCHRSRHLLPEMSWRNNGNCRFVPM